MNFEDKLKNEIQKDVAIPCVVEDKIQSVYRQIQEDTIQMIQADNASSTIVVSRNKPRKWGAWKRIKSRKRRAWKGFVAAACMAFALVGILFANPAFAMELPLIGNIFERLQQQPDPYGKDRNAYEEIAGHSQKTNSPESTATSAGITLGVSDAYCDGYDLYFTLSATTEEEYIMEADSMNLLSYKNGSSIPNSTFAEINGIEVPSDAMHLVKSDDHTFVTLVRIPVKNLAQSPGEKIDFPEEMEIVISCSTIEAKRTNDTSYFSMTDGEWNLFFHASVDRSNNETVELENENNGFVIRQAVKTPSNFHFRVEIPEEWVERNPGIQIFDSAGNKIELMDGTNESLDNGNVLQEWTAVHTDAEDFLLKVIDKNNTKSDERVEIAEIPFSFK